MIIFILLLISVVQGCMMGFSIPSIEIGIMPFIVFIPSLFIIRYTKTYKGAFILGWISGLIMYIIGFNWFIDAFSDVMGLSQDSVLNYIALILFSLVYSIKLPFINLLLKIFDEKLNNLSIIITFPIIITAVDFIIPQFFPFYFGNMMYKDVYLMQTAELFGVLGITFIMALSNVFIFEILSYIFPKFTKSRMKNRPILITVTVMVIIITAHLYGFFRIKQIEAHEKEIDSINIGFIQPNTPMLYEEDEFNNSELYSDKDSDDTISSYARNKCLQLSLEILKRKSNIDLIVWPEKALPSFVYDEPRNANEIKYKEKIKKIIKQYKLYLYMNNHSIEYNNNTNAYINYNNSDLISMNGAVIDSYKKIYLCPFYEYDPFNNTILDDIIPDLTPIKEIKPGNETKLMNFNKWKFSPQVSYEILFPQLVRSSVKHGADFIINTSNDRRSGLSKASLQHVILSLPRAVENRLYVLRNSNSGISAVISPTGKLMPFSTKNGDNELATNIFTQDYMTAKIKPLNIDTFYKQYGDIFAWCVIILFGMMLLYLFFYRIRLKIKNEQ